jgi:Fur family transcriptional regulator, ferric uptake regulator
MSDDAALEAAFDRAGHQLTQPRRIVADLATSQVGHFTALDLVTEARQRRLGVGRATVFRALELFTELGLVERLDLPNGEHAYVVCEPVHHHHVVCERCGRDTEIEACGIDDLAAQVEAQTGYVVDIHRLELFGLCQTCRSQTRAEAGQPARRAH